MTPDRPSDPDKGKAGQEQIPSTAEQAARELSEQQAAEAAEASGHEPAEQGGTPEAEGSAAAETGIDKTAAEAVKPTAARRRDSRPEIDPGLRVRAQARYVRTSARKARLVCDHIRGKDVTEAQAILAFTPRAVAKPWAKLLASAIANAEHNHELVGEDLRVVTVYADEGPTIKRFRPRAQGRATRINKRTSHLSIALGPKVGSNRKGGR